MRLLTIAVLLASLGPVTGCGGGDDGGDKGASGTATGTAAAGAALDEEALLTVHDNLVTCAQQNDDLGLVAHLSGNQAISDSEGVGGSEYDDRLAAPKATVALTGAGAQFVGLRADTRHRQGTSDVDVLILPSDEDAAEAREQLAQEAGGKAEQAGVFVNVTLREASDAAADTLARCETGAMP